MPDTEKFMEKNNNKRNLVSENREMKNPVESKKWTITVFLLLI